MSCHPSRWRMHSSGLWEGERCAIHSPESAVESRPYPKVPLSVEGREPHLHTTGSADFEQLTRVPNTQTYRPRYARCSVLLLFSIPGPRVDHTVDVLSPFISVLCHSVHVLMLSIQAVRDLPRLRALGIVPCIIFFTSQLPCFLMV